MISRYSRPEMQHIWSDETRFSIWLEIELLALEGMSHQGILPKEVVKEVKNKAGFDLKRIQEIEKDVKHDVIAFLTSVSEKVGSSARYIHRGMTSSDILDTGLAIQLVRSGVLISQGVDAVLGVLAKRADEFRHTPCVGRTHGIHAEPITFGLKLLSWYSELLRQKKHLEEACKEIGYGKLSGPVGTYGLIPPKVEAFVMEKLGLRVEPISNQIVPRDRHAFFFSTLALLASSLERFSIEIRHLQRSEVGEVEECFGSAQKGSSSMPHKKNPILSENICGLARLLRGYSLSALENIPLWHERDISHSSVERVIAPDACMLIDFMLQRFRGLVENMVVHTEKMQSHIDSSKGLIFSGSLLIALTDVGLSKEEAYSIVQKHALLAWETDPGLYERVRKDPEITKRLTEQKLEEVFDLKKHLKHVDLIFERVL